VLNADPGMLNLLAWYLTVTLIGLLAFPLAHRLFPSLADHGYSLSRVLGLLVWGYLFWLLASLGVLQNDVGGILLAVVLLAGVSAWLLWGRTGRKADAESLQTESALDWIKLNRRLVITLEIVFLFTLAAFAFFRSANPDAFGTEKPMELMFINSILESSTFPPHDGWLSGYAISYYYFGYVIAAMIAKITATPGTVAFNLILCLLFALSALGAYGIIYNLLAVYRQERRPGLGLPLLGPLFLLLVSNIVGFLTVLHRRGLFWAFSENGSVHSAFWSWLDLRDLSQPPPQPLGWIPSEFWWWWGASRVVRDYDLLGNFREIIDEFPAFSFLLGDVHPHVLAMPFALLGIGATLNLFLGGWSGETNLLGWLRPRISPLALGFAALIFGGLAFLNTWDFPIYLVLLSGAYLLVRVREDGWAWQRALELLEFAIPIGVLSILLYLPFYAGFASQASGILPNLVFPTRGAHLWVMFGTLFLPLLLYLVYLRRGEGLRVDWKWGLALSAGLVILLWLFSWAATAIAARSAAGQALMQSQGVSSLASLYAESASLRLRTFAGLGTLIFLSALTAGFILRSTRSQSLTSPSESTPAELQVGEAPEPRPWPYAHLFALLLTLVAALLVLAPEFVYLRDQFGSRINTIFKFYFQAWILWSLAAAFGSAVLFRNLRGGWRWAYTAAFIALMVMALTYPVLGALNKANGFRPEVGFTLDALKPFARFAPDETAAALWLQQAPAGVIVEAADPGSSYREYARLSEYSGVPTVLGWVGHERQWRGGEAEMGSRLDDIARLYGTPSWDEAQTIIEQYGIKYIVVGNLERTHYQLNEQKFSDHLPIVFRQGNLVIYDTGR
jgi:YYY domain-containing protein